MSTKDDELLRDLGYEQKMHREWSIVQVSVVKASKVEGTLTLRPDRTSEYRERPEVDKRRHRLILPCPQFHHHQRYHCKSTS